MLWASDVEHYRDRRGDVGRKVAHERAERLDAAGRSADDDHSRRMVLPHCVHLAIQPRGRWHAFRAWAA